MNLLMLPAVKWTKYEDRAIRPVGVSFYSSIASAREHLRDNGDGCGECWAGRCGATPGDITMVEVSTDIHDLVSREGRFWSDGIQQFDQARYHREGEE